MCNMLIIFNRYSDLIAGLVLWVRHMIDAKLSGRMSIGCQCGVGGYSDLNGMIDAKSVAECLSGVSVGWGERDDRRQVSG